MSDQDQYVSYVIKLTVGNFSKFKEIYKEFEEKFGMEGDVLLGMSWEGEGEPPACLSEWFELSQ